VRDGRPERRHDVEPAGVGQADIEQHHVRADARGFSQSRRRVARLGHDLVPSGLEERPRFRPELDVIVDQEHRHAHGVDGCTSARRRCTEPALVDFEGWLK
jgi:hypothetical protein